ncbi:MAG TPA: hypothetical protein VKX16_01470, partial [Chloroflexota bacterium]|nr:hypothetical protein [Chloroflexota bacterium]
MNVVYLRRVGVAAAMVLLSVWPVAQSSAASRLAATARAGSSVPTFGEPTISGIQGNGFEQDVRLDNQGRIYTSSPGSLSSTISFMWRSLDGGKTFKWVPGATQPDGKLLTCVGGGDSELATDSAGNLYFNDLTLANFSTARSSDQGTTFPTASCAGVPDAGVDRQWYAVDGDPTTSGEIYLAYDRVAQGQPVTCPNGGVAQVGQNFLVVAVSPLPGGQAEAGVQYGPSQPISCDEGIMGNDEFYNYSDTGKRIFVIHDNAALNSVSMGRCDYVGFGSSTTGLTNCVDNLISSFPNA